LSVRHLTVRLLLNNATTRSASNQTKGFLDASSPRAGSGWAEKRVLTRQETGQSSYGDRPARALHPECHEEELTRVRTLQATVLVDSLAQTKERLDKTGWEIGGSLGSGPSLLARDPDGSLFEFVERPGEGAG
jgi:hypothetical protein